MTATNRYGAQGGLLLLLSFTEGAAVMIAQIAGAKMLAPLYGNSLYVWGSVIGITLISLTAGYYIGGLLSYLRERRRALVLWFMLIAAFLIALMPVSAHRLMLVLAETETIRAIVILTLVYLAPALILLGATPPLIISQLSGTVADSGRAAGTVYGVSTVGGILGTFLAGFWLIPELGLTSTALAAGVGLALLPFALLLVMRHYPALAAPVLFAILLIPGDIDRNHPSVEILYESEGLLGQLKVMDVTFTNIQERRRWTDRILFVNRTGQTWINRDTGEPRWDYVKYLQAIASVKPEGSRTLLLGLGGGVVARKMQDLGHVVDSVELDQRIAHIAREYFGLDPSGEIFVDDGRHFIRSTDRRYDLIVFDVFQAEIPPAHMLTLETFRELRAMLEPGGFLVVNYSGFITGSAGYGARSIYKTLLEAGYDVDLLPTSFEEDTRNNLYVAIPEETSIDLASARRPILVNGAVRPISSFFMDPATIDVADAMILRDNRPILEKLNLEAAAEWRRSYYEYFTRPFLDLGIPLFE